MSTTSGHLIYCRAVPLAWLREYSGWMQDGSADGVVYLHPDGAVTCEPERDSRQLFASDAADWLSFCHERCGLRAAIPAAPSGADSHNQRT